MCSHFPNTFSRGTVQKFRGTLVCRGTPFENPWCKCWGTTVFDTCLCLWSICLPKLTCQLQRFNDIVIRTTDEDFYFIFPTITVLMFYVLPKYFHVSSMPVTVHHLTALK